MTQYFFKLPFIVAEKMKDLVTHDGKNQHSVKVFNENAYNYFIHKSDLLTFIALSLQLSQIPIQNFSSAFDL